MRRNWNWLCVVLIETGSARWYSQHLSDIARVVLITNDAANKQKAENVPCSFHFVNWIASSMCFAQEKLLCVTVATAVSIRSKNFPDIVDLAALSEVPDDSK